MKKLRKALVMVSLVSGFTFSTTLISLAGQWEQQANGQYKYLNDDGSYAISCLVDGYYVNDDGIWITDFQSDWKNTETWKNEKIAKQIGSEIQEEKNFTQNPIRIENNSASYGDSTPVIEITKIESGYDLTLKTRIQSDSTVKGLKAITYLVCDDDFLYNAIFNSYEDDNSLYGINYNEFVKAGNYQIKATLGQNGNSIIYTIIEN